MIKNAQNLMQHITQGVYVISVGQGQQQNAFTAAWLMQVSFQPLLICFSINPQHHSYPLLKQSSVCCISILKHDQLLEADHFGHSSPTDKMQGYNWIQTETGSPALADSLAYFTCRVDHYTDAGDHQLVVCEVLNGTILSDAPPMLYSDTGDMDGSSALYGK